MNKITLSIIIVNYNSGSHLYNCLLSLNDINGKDCEAFIIDNHSTDGSMSNIEKEFNFINIIDNPRNVGFARANNQALEKCSGQYVLLLNPDVEIMPGSLEIMINYLKTNEKVAAVGPKMLDMEGKNQAHGYYNKYMNLVQLLLTAYLPFNVIEKLFPTIYKRYVCDMNFDKASEVDAIPGACLMIKKQVIEKLGFLDNRYFVWMEDVDFCMRIKKAGYKLYYLPQAMVKHVGGTSFHQLNKFKKNLIWASSIFKFMSKNYSIINAILAMLILSPKLLISFILCYFRVEKIRCSPR